ncbi:16S rRNA pseudouridine(516) synthase RsuA [Sansalvadorimonas sp. 2012CJ34-2]|uniref:Pseudouridine synthase n=1 Tax=Parendozoicomonas callyspongiae TaxID=2942213 RepID=A0ABT0PFJ5_9GAMM|nr:16S rRNA pseudouridine(516) synthase RsuA [Sansalvadorimonas sp. 2012CJ34-2]MCL6269786.1 16S rRNA pseudouridine(516) synthase RsuA [Sansalvadorimonas sp. 2012CJ34-2]
MRLDKFLCQCTGLSRTDAKKILHKGEVTCDGVIVKNPGFKVAENTRVVMRGKPLNHSGPRYIMLNKPIDTVSSNTGEANYPSILELLDIPNAEKLMIAGRLDADTTGLVLLTDDGQWCHRITSPKKACGKRYRVWLADKIDTSAVNTFADGILLRSESKKTLPAQLEIISDSEVLLTITEGKYHQIKRMFAAIGNKVVSLHREQVGAIELDPVLNEGEWRELTEEEISSI